VKGLAIIAGEQAAVTPVHPIPGHGVDGDATYRLVSPEEYSLWMVRIGATSGSTMRLATTKGDQAIHVLDGALAVDGDRCIAGGTVVIESDARPSIELLDDSTLLHMGPRDPRVPTDGINGPIDGPGEHAHVVGPSGRFALIDDERDSRYFADSTCPTCRLTLLYTSRSSAYQSATHSHSVDELIHVLWGELQLGSHTLGPGDTLAVAADRRYGFRTPGGFGFLNYRADGSMQTIDPAEPPILEGALVHGFLPMDDRRPGPDPIGPPRIRRSAP
jgi:quercetin dioxygenase-like cupin family protein